MIIIVGLGYGYKYIHVINTPYFFLAFIDFTYGDFFFWCETST